MKIDFSQSIRQLDGTPMIVMNPDGSIASDFSTLAKISVHALNLLMPGDENVAPTKKFERGLLAIKIYEATEPVDMASAEQVSDLKSLIGRSFGSLIIARAFDIIENHPLKTEAE